MITAESVVRVAWLERRQPVGVTATRWGSVVQRTPCRDQRRTVGYGGQRDALDGKREDHPDWPDRGRPRQQDRAVPTIPDQEQGCNALLIRLGLLGGCGSCFHGGLGLLRPNVQEAARESERDACAVVHVHTVAKARDRKDDVGHAAAAVDDAMSESVYLLEHEEVHLVVDVIHRSVEGEQPSRFDECLRAQRVRKLRDGCALHEGDGRQQQQKAKPVDMDEQVGAIHAVRTHSRADEFCRD
mmetsp:Transcript_6143/g.15722  ORF Transcript_6143/g.15722 Transcript_6143/m.15722 type:complete len:242 (+) Transcript_6143:137-862(+)